MFKKGNTLASRGAKTRGPNITISPKKNKGKQPANAGAVAALLASTYKDMAWPCPKCGATVVEATDGNGKKNYWCYNRMCAYIKPKGTESLQRRLRADGGLLKARQQKRLSTAPKHG